jgi:NADH:ubiquinone oxidoreductase subunit E
MTELKICVGSACHLKGSTEIIDIFKQCVEKRNISDKVEIKGAFCLGQCTEAVSVCFNDKIYSVAPESAENFFDTHVMSCLCEETV